MNTYRYDLAQLPEHDRVFFVEMLSYISEYVKDITRDGDSVAIMHEGIEEASIAASVAELEEMINGKLKKMNKTVEVKTLYDYTDREPLNKENIFADMVDKKIVRKISSGAYAYSGIYLKLYRYFCRKIEKSVTEIFPDIEITEFEVPTLTPVADYDEGGYFETFPHHIMFQTTMKNNLEVIDRFSKTGTKDASIFEEITKPNNVLRTAACAPLYPYLRDAQIPQDKPKCMMVSGKCFRNEGANVKELSRLNEFYMKEYVFVGTPEQAKDYVEKAYALWKFWLETFGLNAKIETANDSFFASNYKKLQLFQIIGDSKREFKWLIPGSGDYISCSSANFHRTHFTKTYNIRTAESGAYAHSSCFAFGIERLSYALLSQKGLDISKWDTASREEVEKYW